MTQECFLVAVAYRFTCKTDNLEDWACGSPSACVPTCLEWATATFIVLEISAQASVFSGQSIAHRDPPPFFDFAIRPIHRWRGLPLLKQLCAFHCHMEVVTQQQLRYPYNVCLEPNRCPCAKNCSKPMSLRPALMLLEG